MTRKEFKNRMAYTCFSSMLEEIRYTLFHNLEISMCDAVSAEIEVINKAPGMHIFNLTGCNTKEEAIDDVKKYYASLTGKDTIYEAINEWDNN